jgi:hypothetical protein
VCAAILVLAGLRERAKHPLDDLPPPRESERDAHEDAVEWTEPAPDRAAYRDETLPLKEADPDRPAKVLPPAPREEDLEPPPTWRVPPGKDRG